MKVHVAALLAGSAVGVFAISGGGILPATAQQPVATAQRCAALVGTRLGTAEVTKATMVEAGSKLPPFDDKIEFGFCRVDAVSTPQAGSAIRIQMWLPERWNGKIFGAGGGGFEGGYASAPLGLRSATSAGYAALTTDAGHPAASDPTWAVGNAVKVADYGNRANHVGVVFGKLLVSRYYGAAARHSYFQGCSNGGRDALILAQRHPEDYDAIIAGAPANDFTALMSSFVRSGRIMGQSGVDLSVAKLKLVNEAAVAACDARDGVKDGLISNPATCHFNPAVLQCKPGQTNGCLSSQDIGAVKAVYRGTQNSRGQTIMSGYPVGSEYNWAEWLTPEKGLGAKMGTQFFANFVYGKPDWNPASFNVDRDDRAAAGVGATIDATDTNLTPFLRRGGKLLMYHGWDDAAIPAGNSLRYYAAMRKRTGAAAAAQTRLFLLPGVAHCAGGNGPGNADYLSALDRWTESGTAPDTLVVTKPKSIYRAMAGLSTDSLMTRPVCAWPKVARYTGQGDVNLPASYSCR